MRVPTVDKVLAGFKRLLSSEKRYCADIEMAQNIIELDDHREAWLVGKAICNWCSKRWVAVIYKETNREKLECPNCGKRSSKFEEAE